MNAAINHTNDWVERFKLQTGPALEKFKADNFGAMTARFYPTADAERLKLANDWNSLLFVLDDSMDNQIQKDHLISKEDNFVYMMNRCMEIMEDRQDILGETTGILAALTDIWDRLKFFRNQPWQKSFINHIRHMFEAGLWEFNNVSSGKLPSITEYYSRRPFLGAAHISTSLIIPIENINLDEAVLNHQSLAEITLAAQRAVCLANDLFSFSKEQAHGDQHNMVAIIMEESAVTLPEAINKTVMMHNAEMQKFMSASHELPSFHDKDRQISRYVSILGAILKGNIDWSCSETRRYEFIYG